MAKRSTANYASKGAGSAKENPVKKSSGKKKKENPLKPLTKGMSGLGYSGPHSSKNCASENPLKKGKGKKSRKMGYESTYKINKKKEKESSRGGY